MAVATAPFGASGLFSDGGIRRNDATSAPTEFSASLLVLGAGLPSKGSTRSLAALTLLSPCL